MKTKCISCIIKEKEIIIWISRIIKEHPPKENPVKIYMTTITFLPKICRRISSPTKYREGTAPAGNLPANKNIYLPETRKRVMAFPAVPSWRLPLNNCRDVPGTAFRHVPAHFYTTEAAVCQEVMPTGRFLPSSIPKRQALCPFQWVSPNAYPCRNAATPSDLLPMHWRTWQ